MKLYFYLKRICLLSSISLLMLAAACSSNSGSDATSNADTTHAADVASSDSTSKAKASPDSIAQKDPNADEQGRVWGTKSFASASDAINYMNSSADAAKYSAGIFPRMAEENLPYLTKLLNSPYDRFIVVDKEVMRVILFDKFGREILGYGMACARNYGTKHRKADSRTPEGFFSAEGVYDSTDWLFTNDNGYTSPARGQFGPRFIRVKNPVTTQIGIHGTASPRSIGHRVSHGCIRVKNENILELVKYVDKGMPIIISPSRRDTNVNKSEGYNIPYITTDTSGKYREELQAQYDEEAKLYKEAAEKRAKEQAAQQKANQNKAAATEQPAPAAETTAPASQEEAPAPPASTESAVPASASTQE